MTQPSIAYLGPEGSYSDRATKLLFDANSDFSACGRFDDIFEKVENDQCDYAVLPIENNTAGIVNEAIDLLIPSTLNICAEFTMPVIHSLLSKNDISLKEIQTLYSMSQPYYQSKQFIDQNLKHARWSQTTSSSKALQSCLSDDTSAAIGFSDTGIKLGLQELHKNIQTREDNATRFFVLSKEKGYHELRQPSQSYRATLVFTLKNEPGSLLSILDIFKSSDINMCHIESRRTPHPEWDYYFFISLEVKRETSQLDEALAKVTELTPWSRFLGHYPLLD